MRSVACETNERPFVVLGWDRKIWFTVAEWGDNIGGMRCQRGPQRKDDFGLVKFTDLPSEVGE